MPAISLDRTGSAQTALVSLTTVAALALLGLVLAYWTWAWFAPRVEPRAQAAVLAGSDTVGLTRAATGLFGGAPAGRNGSAPTRNSVGLLGVVAASGGRSSYAVLRLDAKKTVAVSAGAEVEPGLRLVEVHVDHIVLERNGARETLAWPEQGRAAAGAAPLAAR
jgi:general secretion pathway protein C